MCLGDRDAFEQLFRRHWHAVHAVGVRVLTCPESAEDLTQEVFLRIWRTRGQYDQRRGTVRTWILAVAHHGAVDVLRLRARQDRLVVSARSELREQDHAPDALTQTISRGEAREVRAALGELPAVQRHALTLVYGAGLSHAELAARTGVALGTAKGRVRLAQKRLALRINIAEQPIAIAGAAPRAVTATAALAASRRKAGSPCRPRFVV
ncbi:RNA polymerase sigma factor [Miltoncostaea oceani]|uniref:RNA polymerase sigma factor n=1 Tax=Miltoncostaea oceani TaxID=2843216 RepID=UPI001C3C779E|nr:sigma-70 family RNA polymerase sigma factor [Miltoncostaea oceani]